MSCHLDWGEQMRRRSGRPHAHARRSQAEGGTSWAPDRWRRTSTSLPDPRLMSSEALEKWLHKHDRCWRADEASERPPHVHVSRRPRQGTIGTSSSPCTLGMEMETETKRKYENKKKNYSKTETKTKRCFSTEQTRKWNFPFPWISDFHFLLWVYDCFVA